MDEPKIASKTPAVLELEPGETYYWCACGLSENQPFCDGAHQGTKFTPEAFTVDKKKRYALCTCKRSEAGAMCDGVHKHL